MNHWTLYVDESGSFANLSQPVVVAGVLWRHKAGEDLAKLKSQLTTAVPQATWPWHCRDLVMANRGGKPVIEGIVNDVFRELAAIAKRLRDEQTIQVILATETELGDVNPPICCRWRKLFRVLVERAAHLLAMQDGKHRLGLSAQWLPFMQQRPRNADEFRAKNFKGSFPKLAQQALEGMPLSLKSAKGALVEVDPFVNVVSFAETNASIPVGHVLADFCAFIAGKNLRALSPAERVTLGSVFREESGVPLQSKTHGTMRSHVAASGTYYCDQTWLTSAASGAVTATDGPSEGESWLAEHSRQWKGALAGHTWSGTRRSFQRSRR